VVLVTGAYGGLGGAVARAASRAGATVVITGKRKRQLEQLYDAMLAEGLAEPVIHPLDMELATPREYAALAEGLERDFGRLDGIVHAAVSFGGLTPIGMHKPDAWLRAMHVNVNAPFALTQACLPLLTDASDSAVVFVLDDPALLQRAHWGAYGASKAALERFVSLPPSSLERQESLEQLRAVEAGMRIDTMIVDSVPRGSDTPPDLETARSILSKS
jgi:NAD(P)-dependent dehydrogenase (short-subunit alcohol dehydrogenase family)